MCMINAGLKRFNAVMLQIVVIVSICSYKDNKWTIKKKAVN